MKSLIFLFPFLLFFTSCSSTPPVPREELSNNQALEYWPLMAMSANVYEKGNPKIPLENFGWELIDMKGERISYPEHSYDAWENDGKKNGLEFDILRKKRTNEVTIAFRGSQGRRDWFRSNFSVPKAASYSEALRLVRKFEKDNPTLKVTKLTGHSLGGGIALSVSLGHSQKGIPVVVFNTSPRVFDGLGDFASEAERISVFQDREILKKIRFFWRRKHRKILDLELVTDVDPTLKGLKTISLHSNYILAVHLIERASKIDPSLRPLLDDLKAKN